MPHSTLAPPNTLPAPRLPDELRVRARAVAAVMAATTSELALVEAELVLAGVSLDRTA